MPGSTSTSGIGKFSASTTTASKVVASSSSRVYGRSARYADLGQRRGSAAARARRAAIGSIVSGTYRPPSGAEPFEQRASKRDARRRACGAAGRYEAHVETTRAPRGAMAET